MFGLFCWSLKTPGVALAHPEFKSNRCIKWRGGVWPAGCHVKNYALWEQPSHVCSFIYFLWLFSHCNYRVESLQQGLPDLKSLKYLLAGLLIAKVCQCL